MPSKLFVSCMPGKETITMQATSTLASKTRELAVNYFKIFNQNSIFIADLQNQLFFYKWYFNSENLSEASKSSPTYKVSQLGHKLKRKKLGS